MQSSIYFHIPYCRHKCSYCDFVSYDKAELPLGDYVHLLIGELEQSSLRLGPAEVPTIYFGGGTPSLLAPHDVSALLAVVRDRFTIGDKAEITLEANPGILTAATLEGYRRAGINRLSLGVQSFDDRQLAQLGRIHTAEEAREALSLARAAGFDNVGIDLMHGLPEQTTEEWTVALKTAIALKPEHISAYGLSVETGTPFAALAERGALHLPDEEQAAAMFTLTAEILSEAGYEHYEISNFALPGRRSRHNRVYWNRQSYLGFGAGAHSFLESPGYGHRWENPAGLADYAALVNGNGPRCAESLLSRQEAMSEFMFLGLRLLEGVDEGKFARRFGLTLDEAFPGAVAGLCTRGLLKKDGSMVRLTGQGLMLANRVMGEFI